jgi:gamma-glutamyl-gamma-aminobutyrate hydrolase PuuD
MQLINVLLGGTLIKDINEDIKDMAIRTGLSKPILHPALWAGHSN